MFEIDLDDARRNDPDDSAGSDSSSESESESESGSKSGSTSGSSSGASSASDEDADEETMYRTARDLHDHHIEPLLLKLNPITER